MRLCRIEQTPRGIAGSESGLSVLSVMGKDNETYGGLRRIGRDAPLAKPERADSRIGGDHVAGGEWQMRLHGPAQPRAISGGTSPVWRDESQGHVRLTGSGFIRLVGSHPIPAIMQ